MKIGTFRSIPLRLHSSFFLLAAFCLISAFANGGASLVLGTAALIIILFGSVMVHEIGHALVAEHYGIGTRNITLHLLGGFASLEKEPTEPREEIYIALAGPAVNLLLVLLGLILLHWGVPYSTEFTVINAIMGIFNLVPAYPMDGGRVLRALLNYRYGYVKATSIALKVTAFFSVGFIAAGCWYHWIGLIFVGVFLMFITYSSSLIEKKSY